MYNPKESDILSCTKTMKQLACARLVYLLHFPGICLHFLVHPHVITTFTTIIFNLPVFPNFNGNLYLSATCLAARGQPTKDITMHA